MADTWNDYTTGGYMRPEPPPPKSAYTSPSQPTSMPRWGSGYSAPAVRGFQQPASGGGIQSAIDTYESIIKGYDRRDGGGSSTYAETDYSTPSRISPTGGQYRGGSGSRAINIHTPRQIKPFEPVAAPELPEYKARDYKPPKEDESIYGKARQQAISPGMRAMRQRTREAISTAQSLDNPNARSLFIKQALQGYGAGIEGVSAAAGREARAVAGQKRSEQLQIYNSKYESKTSADRINYQAKINQVAQDFANKQSAASMNWQASMDPNVEMGSGRGGYLGGSVSPQTAFKFNRAAIGKWL